ncbi:MAG: outer membrane protein transport protein [Acidobacteriota bacterium]
MPDRSLGAPRGPAFPTPSPRLFGPLAAFALIALIDAGLPRPAAAGNGHFLHGVGAVNSALGGAGVAFPNDALGALSLNPSLLGHMDGYQFQFSLENVGQDNAVESHVGPFAGRTEDQGDDAAVPAFGWTHHEKDSRFAFGMGFLGLAGFSVDYPQDSTNPILSPQPRGFGRFYSSYQYLKIPFAVSYRASDRLSLGASLNLARATLAGDPVGFAAPDCSPSPGGLVCYFPRVDSDSAMGHGLQVGAHFQATPAFALGFSYSTETKFEDFEWNSVHANPSLPNYGTARKIKFELGAPAVAALGLAWTPSPKLAVALDAKRIFYSSTPGFGDSGINPATGAIRGPGWEDIDVFALGIQFAATPKLTLRGGYNKSDNPIPDSQTFFSLFAPGIFENHGTAGIGYQVGEKMRLDLAYYRAFKNDASGPLFTLSGPVPGAGVKQEIALESIILTLSFHLD